MKKISFANIKLTGIFSFLVFLSSTLHSQTWTLTDSSRHYSGYMHSMRLSPDGKYIAFGISSWESWLLDSSLNTIKKIEYNGVFGGGFPQFSVDSKNFFYYLEGIPKDAPKYEEKVLDTLVIFSIDENKIEKHPLNLWFQFNPISLSNSILYSMQCDMNFYNYQTKEITLNVFSFGTGGRVCYSNVTEISTDEKLFAVGTLEYKVQLFNIKKRKLLGETKNLGNQITELKFYDHDTKMLCCVNQHLVAIDLKKMSVIFDLPLGIGYIGDIDISNDEKKALIVGWTNRLIEFDMETKTMTTLATCLRPKYNSMVHYSFDEKKIFVGADETLMVFERGK